MGNQIVSTGSLSWGGAVFRTSTGTVCALFSTPSGIVLYKDVDGTPVLCGSAQSAATVHGTGATITAIDACIDSNDKVHVLSIPDNIEYDRGVAYNTVTGIDSTPSWGTWAEVCDLNGEPTLPSCVIDVDGDDYPRIIWTDEYFYKGVYYSGPYYSHDVGSGWITKERVDTTDQHCDLVYCMAVDSAGDVEVVYESGNTVYYRRRNGSWGTRGSLTNGTGTIKGGCQIDGTTVYRYSGSATDIWENDSSVGADPEATGTLPKQSSAGITVDGDRYVIYRDDTDSYLDYVVNTGSGWSSPDTLEENAMTYCVAQKGTVINAGNGVLDYIYLYNGGIWYGTVGGGTTHNLTATSLVGGTPVLGTPTIGQKHALSASDLTTIPILGTPTLAEEGTDELTALDLDTSVPVLETPTLGQKHALSASALETTPALGKPTLGQVHDLDANDLISGAAVLGTPTCEDIGATHNLTAQDLDAEPAVLDKPTIGQVHALDGQDLTTTPVLGMPTLAEVGSVDLTALDLVGGTPDLESPTLGQKHNLTASALVTTPVLGKPTLGQVHALDANDLTTTPALGTPAVGLYDDLTASDLVGGTPVLGTPTLAVVGDALYSADLISEAPVLGKPTLTQIHALEAVGITIPAYNLPSPAVLYIPEDYVTPQERTYNVPVGNRTSNIGADPREYSPPFENREFCPEPPIE